KKFGTEVYGIVGTFSAFAFDWAESDAGAFGKNVAAASSAMIRAGTPSMPTRAFRLLRTIEVSSPRIPSLRSRARGRYSGTDPSDFANTIPEVARRQL